VTAAQGCGSPGQAVGGNRCLLAGWLRGGDGAAGERRTRGGKEVTR